MTRASTMMTPSITNGCRAAVKMAEWRTPGEKLAVPPAPAPCCAVCQPGTPQHAQHGLSLLVCLHLLLWVSAVPDSTPAHTLNCSKDGGQHQPLCVTYMYCDCSETNVEGVTAVGGHSKHLQHEGLRSTSDVCNQVQIVLAFREPCSMECRMQNRQDTD